MTKAKIISDPKILGGKPIIAGTRVSVELIMNFLAAGMNTENILEEYPELKKNEVLAAVEYAAKLVSKRKLVLGEDSQANATVTLHEITR